MSGHGQQPTVTILREIAGLDLRPTQPFDFDGTFHKPDHFPSSDTVWQPGTRWQAFRFRGILLGLRIEDAAPLIRVRIWAERPQPSEFLTALASELSWRANLRLDLAPFERTVGQDSLLGPAIERQRGMRPMHLGSLYEYLVIAVVLQNATVRRSAQMLQALFDRFGTPLHFDDRYLFGFWEPCDLTSVSELDLRTLKVGYRARPLLRLSQAFGPGGLDETSLRGASVEMQRQVLLSLYGIGPASVGYLLTDVFHAFDEVRHISPWEQRIYSRLLFGTPVDRPELVEVILRRIDAWAPWRALAIHYLWEDLFRRHEQEPLDWLSPLIRL